MIQLTMIQLILSRKFYEGKDFRSQLQFPNSSILTLVFCRIIIIWTNEPVKPKAIQVKFINLLLGKLGGNWGLETVIYSVMSVWELRTVLVHKLNRKINLTEMIL